MQVHIKNLLTMAMLLEVMIKIDEKCTKYSTVQFLMENGKQTKQFIFFACDATT